MIAREGNQRTDSLAVSNGDRQPIAAHIVISRIVKKCSSGRPSRTASSRRLSARLLHHRSSRRRSDHAQLLTLHPVSTADDQRRLRGLQPRQFAAPRSDVQHGARSFSHRSGVVLSVDNIAVRESAIRSRPAAHAQGDDRSVCESFATVPERITLDITTRSMRPTVVSSCAVQRPLRRIRISADRRVRRRGPLHHRRASPRQAAERQGDQALPVAPVARHPRSLLHGDPAAGRQPLLRSRGSRSVSRHGLDYILGIAPTATLRRHVEGLEASTKARFEASPRDAASSFHRVLRRRAKL